MRLPRFVIGAASSGAGKTSLALGLLGALSRFPDGGLGLDARPFKIGPDYIDSGLQSLVAGKPGRNLDPRLMGRRAVMECLARNGSGGSIAVIEGVMGYYDGEPYSSADVAALIQAPAVLILNASAAAESCAATALGFIRYRRRSGVRAFILNRVSGEGHYAMAARAIERATGLPVLGYLPDDPALSIPERHLGLAGDAADFRRVASSLARAVSSHVNLKELLSIAASAPDLPEAPARFAAGAPSGEKPVVAVARDEAFSFYYQDNLDELERLGADLAFFSPLRDAALPARTAAVYLGGGYPELHAEALAANAPMRSAIRAAVESGMPVYAECGGYLYLLDELCDASGSAYPGCGIFPGRARMGTRLAALGYRDCATLTPSLAGPAGTHLSGHVFHYATVEDPGTPVLAMSNERRSAETPALEGATRDQAFGSFLHVHFAANGRLARRIVAAARRYGRKTK